MHHLQHLFAHWDDVLTGASALAILAHAVNSFPTPANKYGAWFLGVCKVAVGQRVSGMNAFAGMQTAMTAVTDDQKDKLKNGATLRIIDAAPTHDMPDLPGEATGRHPVIYS